MTHRFADKDPEDAYDATDPIDDRLDVLERVVNSLRDTTDHRAEARRIDALRLVRNLDVLELKRRERRRLERIRDDLEDL